jgi:major membrane immunogen (membrane-anchored lipoprotein)
MKLKISHMKKYIIGTVLSLSLILTACRGKSLDEVKTGMSESEVKELLGDPNGTSSNSSSSSMNGEETSASSSAEWTYNGTGKIFFEDGKVVKTEKQSN